MLDLDSIRERLNVKSPVPAVPPANLGIQAAVALILHQEHPDPTELLFIQRTRREGDRWAGDMAFPGGRREDGDTSLQATACREAEEEVGIWPGKPIGQLDDFDARVGVRPWPLVIRPYVFILDERLEFEPNDEVQDVLWISLPDLADPANSVLHQFGKGTRRVTVPALSYDGHTIWGITFRVLEGFFRSIGGRLPLKI